MTAKLAFNLAGMASNSLEMPFINILMQCNPVVQNFGSSPDLTHQQLIDNGHLNAQGYPISIPSGNPLRINVGTIAERDNVPHVAVWEGTGTVSLSNVNNYVVGDHRITFTTKPVSGGSWQFNISATDSGDPIRNWAVFRADHEAFYLAGQKFDPRFLAFVRGSGASQLRFMDWMVTNGSAQSEWANRPKADYSTWRQTGGVPLEIMVELANDLQIDPWFTFPHLATDEYVEEFSIIVRDGLDEGLTPRFEYSNETWNSAFTQTSYCQTQGIAAGWTTGTNFDKSQLWVGYRMAQCSEIVRSVFGTDSGDGWEGVLSTWPTSTDHTNKRLTGIARHISNDGGVPVGTTVAKLFSDIATTTYFGSSMVGNTAKRNELIAYFAAHTADECYAWINEKMLEESYASSIPDIAAEWAAIKAIADANGIGLSSYEGGTHIVQLFGLEGSIPVETRDVIFPILIEHAYREEMAELYEASWDAWAAITDRAYTHYVSIAAPTYYGTWGAKRSLTDNSPRWAVLTSKSRGLPYQPGFVGVTVNVST